MSEEFGISEYWMTKSSKDSIIKKLKAQKSKWMENQNIEKSNDKKFEELKD
jgi:hypothetical protein